MPDIIPNNIEIPISESHNSLNSDSEICHSISNKENQSLLFCTSGRVHVESRTQITNENEMSKLLKKEQ